MWKNSWRIGFLFTSSAIWWWNLFGDIIKFVSDNKDTIKNIAGVASSVSDTVGKVGSTTLDIVKKARELKNCPPAITEEATEKVMKAGSGFYYV